MRPHSPSKKARPISTKAQTRMTRSIGSSITSESQRQGWIVGHLVSRLLHSGRHDRRAPALVAASPQAPVTDWFVGDDWHHNGALFLPHMFNFMARFERPRPVPTKNFNPTFDHGTPDGYEFFLRMGPLGNANGKYFKNDVAFWSEAMRHGTYDEFWKSRNLRPHLQRIRPAVMTVGGWFDARTCSVR